MLKARVAGRRVSFDVSTPLKDASFAGLPVTSLVIQGAHTSFLSSEPETVLSHLFAYGVSSTAVSAINSIVFLLMSFASGIFIPVQQLPDFVQKLAPYLPLYRLAELGWNAVGAQNTAPTEDILWLWLLGYGIIFTIIALLAVRREEQQSFA
jgi:uncharacterized phage infection (PIP) family protein YhgE